MLLYQGQQFPSSSISTLYVFGVFELQRVSLILLYLPQGGLSAKFCGIALSRIVMF